MDLERTKTLRRGRIFAMTSQRWQSIARYVSMLRIRSSTHSPPACELCIHKYPSQVVVASCARVVSCLRKEQQLDAEEVASFSFSASSGCAAMGSLQYLNRVYLEGREMEAAPIHCLDATGYLSRCEHKPPDPWVQYWLVAGNK